MKKQIIDENEIVKLYLTTNIGIEALATKYKVGKKRIKEILIKNNIEIKKKGNQNKIKNIVVTDYKTHKYVNTDEYHYIVYDEKTNFQTKDINNLGGVITSYLKKEYNLFIPTLYERRKYYITTGNYWWEQFLKYKKIINKKVKKCPYCNWNTIDIENNSGAFENHLKNVHNISKLKYIEHFPEEIDYFSLINPTENLQMESNNDQFVVCKICGKKLKKISNTHLKKHNITKDEYIQKYGFGDLLSNSSLKKFQVNGRNLNINLNTDKLEQYTSKAEIEIKDFLKSYGVSSYKDRKILQGVELDLFIPEYNFAIEYNGNLWHSELFGHKDRNYHINKLKLCNFNNVSLIQICDDEYINNKELVLHKILHILGKNNNEKIYARKCKIKHIFKYESDAFLEKYHIQGKVRGTVYYGCYYGDKLIAVMVFKKGSLKNQGWELVRFASDYHYVCCGVGGKMFNFFKNENNPITVTSFADRRWTTNVNNNLYTKLGFQIEKILNPDYKYYHNKLQKNQRIHKMSLSKNIMMKRYGFDKRLTEWEMAQQLGYDRIWDCGLIKYVWKKEETT